MQAHLDVLRTQYFPAERNQLAAHLTLFHAIPAHAHAQLFGLLEKACARPPIPARLEKLVSLGRGFAVKVEAPTLLAVHRRLRTALRAELSAQDGQGLWPHVTLQNKVPATQAKHDLALAQLEFVPQPAPIEALVVWRYRGGPWSLERRFPLDC